MATSPLPLALILPRCVTHTQPVLFTSQRFMKPNVRCWRNTPWL